MAELIYIPSAASGQIAVVGVHTAPIVSFDAPVLVPARVTANRPSGVYRAYDVLPDGKFIGPRDISGANSDLGSGQIRVVLNWTEELKQRVPAK